ncbi:protein yellow-like [Schistocerca serialis cubense]|uniref:protein yellow-like n=1 Tax=Schistocerca serialis cubense TaxID=2023355 RepID=UPI00214E292A|nr:protein yellow-like [Schistocerca serialis cubense]
MALAQSDFPHWFAAPPILHAPAFDPAATFPEFHNQHQHTDGSGASRLLPLITALTAMGLRLLPHQRPQPLAQDDPWTQSRVATPPPPPLRTLYQWRQIDFEFPSELARQQMAASGRYVRRNALPLGLDVYGDRIFVSVPRWKDGIPATLATIPRDPAKAGSQSPALRPYPSWDWHGREDCVGLTSVYRMHVDPCGRLWVLDSGVTNAIDKIRQQCAAQIFLFDLRTDQLIMRHVIPSDQYKEGSLLSNIVSDVRDGQCEDAFAYATDVWGFSVIVFSLRERRSWSVSHPFFYPDPLAARYQLHGVSFRWTDGVFGLSLSPAHSGTGDRTLFFHPMSSFREFAVLSSILRNETAAKTSDDEFHLLEEPRGLRDAHASASAMDRRGVMFYNLVTRDAVGCWNSAQPHGYRMSLQGIVAQDNVTLIFPNDLKVDHELRQNLWVLSNRLPLFLYRELDPNDINFRIMTGSTDELVRGTVCDPDITLIPGQGALSPRNQLCPANEVR